MNPNFSSLKIKTTPLVQTYLQNNFGTPVSINERHVLHKLAFSQLCKHNTRPIGGSGYSKDYKEVIELNMSYNNFRFDGYYITEINTRNFNEAVKNYIRNIWRTNLDSLLVSQQKQSNWKDKFFELIDKISGPGRATHDVSAIKKQLKHELEEHEINIKKAIDFVILETLKLDYNVLSYETVKRDYYRYRNPDQYEKEKKQKKVSTPLSLGLDLFSELDEKFTS